MAREYHYLFTVLGRYPSHIPQNAPHVTVNMAAGRDDHFVHCGTLTMNEREWDEFVGALRDCLGEAIQVKDGGRPPGR